MTPHTSLQGGRGNVTDVVSEREPIPTEASPVALAIAPPSVYRTWFLVLGCVALTYALLAGLRTVTDWDLGWQLATGRWIVQHHQIPSIDVFSYTAQGQPWKYPVLSGLIFYALYLLGQYTLLSCLGAAACVGTTALLLRRGSPVTAVLAILAIPRIALRTTPRADMFTVVLFAAFLSLLWEQYETGRARLWLMPVLMIAWCNLHLGLAAGLGLIAWYVMAEGFEMLRSDRRTASIDHLRRAWPWFLATLGASLMNPWGWGIYPYMFGFMAPMSTHAPTIDEWDPARLNWAIVSSGLSLQNPNSFVLLLLVVALAVPLALFRRQFGAAVLLCAAATMGIRHLRLQVLFSVVVVIVAGAVLTSACHHFQSLIKDVRTRNILFGGACCVVVLLACLWSANLVSNRTYLGSTDFAEFGTGRGWWFPEGAAAFIEREKIPGQVFNSYSEGGFVSWRLGEKYRDYVDGRGSPFGAELIERSTELMASSPDSPVWQSESERYDINAVIVPIARYKGIESFPVLRQFCSSITWKPVYLDEVSAVFVRHTPSNENLLNRLQIDCDTTPIPRTVPAGNGSKAFNQWANAAAVLKALGRNSEAYEATSHALTIFPDSGFIHFTRAEILNQAGKQRDAEEQYLAAVSIEPNELIWSRLATLYEQQQQLDQAIPAWNHVADLASDPYPALLSLGYDYLSAHRPKDALKTFDRAQESLSTQTKKDAEMDGSSYANLAHGRAAAFEELGDLNRAISFEEETVRITPDRSDDWAELARLYSRVGRIEDAQRANQRALGESVPISSAP